MDHSDQRVLYYDLIRIVSCFLVILNHSIGIFDQFEKIGSLQWMLSSALFYTSKAAVPLFFMLGGGIVIKKRRKFYQII